MSALVAGHGVHLAVSAVWAVTLAAAVAVGHRRRLHRAIAARIDDPPVTSRAPD